MVNLRPALAIGTAVLAAVVGTVGADASGIVAASPASAAEDRSDLVSSRPTVQVTNRELRRVDSIELDAESLVFRDGDDTVADVSMRDSRSTVDLLGRLLGTPSRTQTAAGDGGACFPAGTTSTWGGAIRVAALRTPASVGNAVEIRVLKSSVRTRIGSRVELTGPDGVQVGDDVADELHDAPSADKESYGSGDARAWQLLLEPGWEASDDDGPRSEHDADANTDADDRHGDGDDEQGSNGVSALTDDTEVTVIGAPMPVHARRSC
ncbi:hypothetical protein Cus16_1355 [Curtobacterium sp. ER1/6]|nr:hypothetical protein Cus16_1355 [Curtobacterium sp. ER1/6]